MHNASPVTPLTIGGSVRKASDDLDILGVTIDSTMILRSIFSLFPEQLLKCLVSLGNPGPSKINYFLGDAFWDLSCPF